MSPVEYVFMLCQNRFEPVAEAELAAVGRDRKRQGQRETRREGEIEREIQIERERYRLRRKDSERK